MVCPGQSSLEVSLVSIMPVWWQETRRFGTAGDDRFLRSFDRTGCDQSSHHPSAVARHDAAILLASAASPLADTRASHAHAHRCSPLELLSPRIAFVAPPHSRARDVDARAACAHRYAITAEDAGRLTGEGATASRCEEDEQRARRSAAAPAADEARRAEIDDPSICPRGVRVASTAHSQRILAASHHCTV
jgi:hypothetical protein